MTLHALSLRFEVHMSPDPVAIPQQLLHLLDTLVSEASLPHSVSCFPPDWVVSLFVSSPIVAPRTGLRTHEVLILIGQLHVECSHDALLRW